MNFILEDIHNSNLPFFRENKRRALLSSFIRHAVPNYFPINSDVDDGDDNDDDDVDDDDDDDDDDKQVHPLCGPKLLPRDKLSIPQAIFLEEFDVQTEIVKPVQFL